MRGYPSRLDRFARLRETRLIAWRSTSVKVIPSLTSEFDERRALKRARRREEQPGRLARIVDLLEEAQLLLEQVRVMSTLA
jgi:hypothetical protein